jgi:D-proline reductase (dithiol) PrdB
VVTIQRAIEMFAYPTVLVTVAVEQTEQARPPRAFHPEPFTLGHALGRPGDAALQKRILLDALDLFIHPQEPGTIARKRYE